MRFWTTHSPAETAALGETLAAEVAPDGLVLLFGEMGSGKTVLAQGLARGLGIDAGEVQSPTYTLIREHRGERADMIHVDLYRLESADVDSLGLEELFAERSVKVVEWADRLADAPPADLALDLARGGDPEERRISERRTPGDGRG